MSETEKYGIEFIMARLDKLENIVKELTDIENERLKTCTSGIRVQDNRELYDCLLRAIKSVDEEMNVKYENEDGQLNKDSSDKPEYVSIPKSLFDSIIKGMDASPKSFLLWALDKDILLHNEGCFTRVTRMNQENGNQPTRCVTLRLYIDD